MRLMLRPLFALSVALGLALAAQAPRQLRDPSEMKVTFRRDQVDIREALSDLFEYVRTPVVLRVEISGTVTIDKVDATFEAVLQTLLKQVNATYRVEGGRYWIIPKGDWIGCYFGDPDEVAKRHLAGDDQFVFELKQGKVEKVDIRSHQTVESVNLERRFKAMTVNLGTVAGRERLRRLFRIADYNLLLAPELKGVVTIPEGPSTLEVAIQGMAKSLGITPTYAGQAPHLLLPKSRYLSLDLVGWEPLDSGYSEPAIALDAENVQVTYGCWKYKIRKSDMKILEYSEIEPD